jgi:hypothetical protein
MEDKRTTHDEVAKIANHTASSRRLRKGATVRRGYSTKSLSWFFRDAQFSENTNIMSRIAQLVLQTFLGSNNQARKYYVDLAANHPMKGSSTYDLDKNGWGGLCIEANPYFSGLLREHRSCAVFETAIDSIVHNVTFVMGGAMGGIEDERFDNRPLMHNSNGVRVTLRTQTLVNVLKNAGAPKVIDYLSLDVEGAENSAIPADFAWENYKFLTLSIERPPPSLNVRLFEHGYLFVRNFAFDTFYVHNSHPNVARFQSNSSFQQVPAKCRTHVQHLGRKKIDKPCTSIFGCCHWPHV